jgi:ankyrin repeat protein
LQVLTWSERPLRIEEAVDFLAVTPECEPGFDEKNRIPVPKEILKLCSSLVTIVPVTLSRSERDHSGFASSTVQEMQLSHFSVKEYFRSNRLDKKFQQDLCETSAAGCIARVSLTYLLHVESDLSLRERKWKFPLSRHSAQYWMRFTRIAGAKYGDVQKMAVQLLSDHEQYVKWISIFDPDAPWTEEPELSARLPEPLYYASMEGLESATAVLISKGADINAKGGRCSDALQAACSEGREKLAAMLLEKGADINAEGGSYGSALQAACSGGHEKLAAMLFEMGADINAEGGYYGSALQAACSGGHEKLAAMLFEMGADINAKEGSYGSALQAACSRGHEKLAAMLFEMGADINAEDEYYGGALQAACSRGHEKLAAMLLEKGADINAKGGHYGGALQAASSGGHEKLAAMLLKKGADINAKEGSCGSALEAACSQGYEKLAVMLVEKGADINAEDRVYGSALQAACSQGYEKLAAMLLEKGADINAEDGYYGGALQAACSRGHEKLASMLLKKGADINSGALHAACSEGHEKLAAMLLEKGADTNSGALHAACSRGHEKLAAMLLEKGADINSGALQAACSEGHEKTVSLLIKYGANPLVASDCGWNSLDFAAAKGSTTIMKLLLHGARYTDLGETLECSMTQNFLCPDPTQNISGARAYMKWLTSRHAHAFLLAARRGHMDVSRLLLTNDLSLELGRESCVSSLLATTPSLREEIVARTSRHNPHREEHTLCCCNVVLAAACSQNRSLLAMLLSSHSLAQSPSEEANGRPEETAVDILQDLGRDINAFLDAASVGDRELLNHNFDSSIGVDVHDGCGWSALHEAANGGKTEVVRWLLEHKKADNNLRLEDGSKAIQCAAQQGHTDIVSLLVEHGSCVNEQNWNHRTPLHYAAEAGNFETAKYLIEKGADRCTRTLDGATPAHLAREQGHDDISCLLASSSCASPTSSLPSPGNTGLCDQPERPKRKNSQAGHEQVTKIKICKQN